MGMADDAFKDGPTLENPIRQILMREVDMKLLILITLLATPMFAKADIDCSKHKIYCHIVQNKKKTRDSINHKYVMHLSNVIHHMTRKHKVDPQLFTSILMQESRYRLFAKGKSIGLRKETDGERYYRCLKNNSDNYSMEKNKDKFLLFDIVEGNQDNKSAIRECLETSEEKLVEDIVYSDFGISQIHYKTIARYNFDAHLLLTDLEYSVEAGAIVLKNFMKAFANKGDPDWWTRYNCGYRTTTKRSTCQKYKRDVTRWFYEEPKQTEKKAKADAGPDRPLQQNKTR